MSLVRRFNFLASSVVLQQPSAIDGEPTMIESIFALDIATLRRFGSNKKSSPLGAISPELEVNENIEIKDSCPWKLSTVPILILPLNFRFK